MHADNKDRWIAGASEILRPARQRRRVCVITPGHLATNPRIVKEADALAEAGYDVTVIAADYMKWARNADQEFEGRAWRLSCKVPFGPRAPKLTYIAQSVRRRTAGALVKLGGTHRVLIENANHPIHHDLVRAAIAVPAELYIAHYVAALPAAARAASANGGQYAFDAEDFHLGDFPDDPEFSFEHDIVRSIEQRYLRSCAYLTAASPGIAKAYADTYGLTTPTVALNVFPRADAPRTPTPTGSTVPGPSLYWFSQTIGRHRGLENALKAVSISSAHPHLHVRGLAAADYATALNAKAVAWGVGEQLHLLDRAPPSHMVRLAAAYDIGLSSETGITHNRKIALNNKLFTFLLAGIPVVASAIPAHRDLRDAHEAVFLYNENDPVDLARVLDELLLDPAKLANARKAAWQLGQDRYNWDFEKRTLVSVVDKALGVELKSAL